MQSFTFKSIRSLQRVSIKLFLLQFTIFIAFVVLRVFSPLRLIPFFIKLLQLNLSHLSRLLSYYAANSLLLFDIIVANVSNSSKYAFHAMIKSRQIGQFSLANCKRFSRTSARVLFRKSIPIIRPQITIQIRKRTASRQKCQSFFELIDLNLQVIQYLNKLQGSDATLRNISPINAIKAIRSNDPTLRIQHFHLIFDPINSQSCETAVIDSFRQILLQKNIQFRIVLIAAISVYIVICISHFTMQLLLSISLFSQFANQVLIVLNKLLLLLRRGQKIHQKDITKIGPFLHQIKMLLKPFEVILYCCFKFHTAKTIGTLDFTPEQGHCSPALQKRKIVIFHDQYLLSLDIVASISFTINSSCITLSTSSFYSSPTDKDDVKPQSIDVQFQSSDKALNHRYSPHGIERLQLCLQMISPVEISFVLSICSGLIHSKRKVIGEREVHSLLEYSRDIQQYFSLLFSESFLLQRIIKQINQFSDLEYISLSNTAHNGDLLSQNYYALPSQIQNTNQTTEEVRFG